MHDDWSIIKKKLYIEQKTKQNIRLKKQDLKHNENIIDKNKTGRTNVQKDKLRY